MRCSFARGFLALAGLFLTTAAFAQDRPARQNPAFSPAAASAFNSLTTGVVLKIKSASIAKDGTIVARFTLTDTKGAGLDVNGVQTAGVETLRFVAAYI